MFVNFQVEAIIVRPESEVAIIQLHEGAVIKGKKVCTLVLPDAKELENTGYYFSSILFWKLWPLNNPNFFYDGMLKKKL